MTNERLFLAVPWGCLRFVTVVFPDHTHLLFFEDKPMGHRLWGCVLSWVKKRVGPKISSVNILILNQGCPMNNIIPLPESS